MAHEAPYRLHWLTLSASLIIVLAGIKAASVIIVPFILAVFIAIICMPLVHGLMRWKIPRSISIISILLGVVLLTAMLAGVVGSSMNQLVASIPLYREQFSTHLQWITQFLETHNIHISLNTLLDYFDPGAAISLATNLLASFSGTMANLFLILLVVMLMLLEAPSLSQRLHIALADPHMRQSQIDQFFDSVKHYMAIKTVISLITGFMVGFFLWCINLEFFILWGLLAFLLNYIPNVGSVIAAIPPILLASIQLGFADALLVVGFFLTLNLIIGNLIEPRIMGNGLGLSTLVVFLSLIFWGWLLGSVGMLLSVPLTMIVKIGLETQQDSAWFAFLLTSKAPQQPSS